tara:strand:- start:540 stop:809 length:270 start_codon:yes stop_codon:yes gene_type:complete
MSGLKQTLFDLAKAYDIDVEISYGDPFEIVLFAPIGYQFDTDLHSLVTRADSDIRPAPAIYRGAIRDARLYGPDIERCPKDCDCGEGLP